MSLESPSSLNRRRCLLFAGIAFGVLSDDLVPIALHGGVVLAHPSHTRVTMWPDSASALFGPQPLPALTPSYEKRYLDLQNGHRYCGTPAPLAVIYVLGERTCGERSVQSDPLPPADALMALVTHTYGNYLADSAMRAREFEVLAQVVQSVPVRRLAFPDGVDRLLQSCQELATAGTLSATSRR